jgi:hypothetical protein
MLPAPMVFPRTQSPEGAGIVVLDFPDALPACLDSVGLTTGAGPPPLAAVVVMSEACRDRCDRRWSEVLPTDSVLEGGGRSLVGLLRDVCATFEVS